MNGGIFLLENVKMVLLSGSVVDKFQPVHANFPQFLPELPFFYVSVRLRNFKFSYVAL